MRGKYCSISDLDRQRIVEAYLAGKNAQMISTIMGVKRTTVSTIISKFVKDGQIEKMRRGGARLPKLTDEQTATVKSWVDADCSISLPKLKEKCLAEFGVNVSEGTLSRIMKSFSYTIKRIHLLPARRNDAVTIEEWRRYSQTFLELFTEVSETQIYFLDEVGFCVAMRAKRGRSLRGTRAVQVAPGLRTRNISICCAMNSQGILHYAAQTRAYNRQYFCTFLDDVFRMLDERGVTYAVLIMDNVRFHKGDEIRFRHKGRRHRQSGSTTEVAVGAKGRNNEQRPMGQAHYRMAPT
uniref:Tc1-like transposase DDE domain-containing protein n=1 Tax=Plectus sambesii TaxID=2011161 RepID=A0A914ULD0_9BILA